MAARKGAASMPSLTIPCVLGTGTASTPELDADVGAGLELTSTAIFTLPHEAGDISAGSLLVTRTSDGEVELEMELVPGTFSIRRNVMENEAFAFLTIHCNASGDDHLKFASRDVKVHPELLATAENIDALEAFLVPHARERVMITPKDIQLARRIRGERA